VESAPRAAQNLPRSWTRRGGRLEAAGKSIGVVTTIVGIRSVDLLEADMQARNAVLTAKIVSDQINMTRDGEGRVIDGDPTAVVAITDIWTFSRNTRSRDPNWTLVATRSPN